MTPIIIVFVQNYYYYFFFIFFMYQYISDQSAYHYQNPLYYCSYHPYTFQNTHPLQITLYPLINQALTPNIRQFVGESEENRNRLEVKKQSKAEEISEMRKMCATSPKIEQILQKKISQNSKQINMNPRMKAQKVEKAPILYKNAYLSFLFNKILKFIQNRSQSQIWVKNLFKKNNINDYSLIDQFFQYAADQSKRIINQVSIQKVKEFWIGHVFKQAPKGISQQKIQTFHLAFRVLTKVYLKDIYGVYILKSKKIKKQGRMNHLRMRRCLLKNLKDPKQFKSYKDF